MQIDRSYRLVLAGMEDAIVPDADKAEIIDRQNGLCFYCEQRLPAGIIWDHFVPRRLGGPHHLNNRVAACRPCDGRKGGREPTEAEIIKFLGQIVRMEDAD